MSEKNIFVNDPTVLDIVENGKTTVSRYSGVNGQNLREITTNYQQTPTEKVIRGITNSFIILGKDRDAGAASGYGGSGTSGASCIDIIAGHMGPRPVETFLESPVYSGKDFKNDSARVYITQTADIDTYFEIPKIQAKLGSVYLDLEMCRATSAFAAKADNLRLIARENIKLVTFHKGINSANKDSFDGGIDIVAGCNALATGSDLTLNLQPMVKGNNLVQLLKEIITRIDDTQKTVASFMNKQKEINDKMSKHVHQSGAAGTVTSDIVGNDISIDNFTLLTDVLPNIVENFIKTSLIESDYFLPLNEKFINSIWNRVN